jgi:malate synthase
VKLDDGQVMTTQRLSKIMDEELAQLRQKLGAQRFDGGHFAEASKMFYQFSTSAKLADFLTNAAYERLVQVDSRL